MIRRLRGKLLLPAVLLTAGACVATRKDVDRLELTLRAIQDTARAGQSRSDSLTRTLVREATQLLAAQFTREFNSVSDSVRQVAASLQRLDGDVKLSMHDLRSQLTTLQEGIGQTQRRLNDVRTSVEASVAAPVQRPAVPPGSATAAPGMAGPPSDLPAAAQLYQTGRRQLLTKAITTARSNFQLLIEHYPEHDLVPRAQFGIAESFAAEGNRAAADSVFALVVEKYPDSDDAPNALFKRARLAADVKDSTRAILLFQQIIDRYPRSEERQVAEDELQKLRKP